ncbi:MAG: hypothetical protein C4586_08415 [Anaerolineaceae bacterium]|nr:MAG: hypothetical protein C4586_08415 [Anaerolineaceae bacterium]
MINKKNAKRVLQDEIEWCRANKNMAPTKSESWRKGFISGLMQAKRLLRQIPAEGSVKHVGARGRKA